MLNQTLCQGLCPHPNWALELPFDRHWRVIRLDRSGPTESIHETELVQVQNDAAGVFEGLVLGSRARACSGLMDSLHLSTRMDGAAQPSTVRKSCSWLRTLER